jgi:hypothetical protein
MQSGWFEEANEDTEGANFEFVAGWIGPVALTEAHRQLPAIVDTDRDARLLARLGIDPAVVIGQFNGIASGNKA